PVDFEDMAERVLEAEGGPMAEIAGDPAMHLVSRGFDRLDAPLQRLRAGGAVGDVADAGGVPPGELERAVLVIVPGPEIGRGFVLARKLQAVDAREEVEALHELVGIHLDMGKMGDVEAGFHGSLSLTIHRRYAGRSTGSLP